ncbi:hypothetical protein HK096_005610 [Nowakowskiella sp. JEL0078]|nr:hypothetical protein HK096_005610 [Nowakowskiella sp. JEL0078]
MMDLKKLWKYNGTIYDKNFLIDVNPNSINRVNDPLNIIDARVIDIRSGLYLDLTALADHELNQVVSCKTPHKYAYDDIFPLHQTSLNGVEVWRPNLAISILVEEYKETSLVRKTHIDFDDFRTYIWNEKEEFFENSQN